MRPRIGLHHIEVRRLLQLWQPIRCYPGRLAGPRFFFSELLAPTTVSASIRCFEPEAVSHSLLEWMTSATIDHRDFQTGDVLVFHVATDMVASRNPARFRSLSAAHSRAYGEKPKNANSQLAAKLPKPNL